MILVFTGVSLYWLQYNDVQFFVRGLQLIISCYTYSYIVADFAMKLIT